MFRAYLKGGQIYHGPRSFLKFKEWAEANEGKTVTIDLEKQTRSSSQIRFYWLYLGIIERETGQNADDVHEWAKRKFLPPRFITVNKEEIKIPGSTSGLDKLDFSNYMDKICAATNIPIPDPTEAGFISNY